MTTSESNNSPQQPGRRRLSEQQRRHQIIRATIEVVAARGYGGSSLAHVAERAGVSKGLIWRYFTDRDDLMEQTVTTTLSDLRETVAAEIDLTVEVPGVIRAAIRRAAALPGTHAAELTALNQIIHNLRGPDGAPRLTLQIYEDTYRAQETVFRRGQAEGSLRSFDTRVMAVTYQGALDAMLAYLDSHPEADPADYAESLGDILLAGIVNHDH